MSVLILIVFGLTIALFVTPGSSPWFRPTAGVPAASIGLGILIPLGPRRT